MHPVTDHIQWIKAGSTGPKSSDALRSLLHLIGDLCDESNRRLTACTERCSWAMEVNGKGKEAPFTLMDKTLFLQQHPGFVNVPAGDNLGVLVLKPINEAWQQILSQDSLPSLQKHSDVMGALWNGKELVIVMAVRSNLGN